MCVCVLWQDCYLVSILNELAGNAFMIFCSTCNNAQRVALLLRNLGITAIPLHGQMSQVDLQTLKHNILVKAQGHKHVDTIATALAQ